MKKTADNKTKLIMISFIVLLFMSLIFIRILIKPSFGFKSDPVSKVYFAANITPTHQKIIDRFNELYAGQIEVIPVDYLSFTNFLLINQLIGES